MFYFQYVELSAKQLTESTPESLCWNHWISLAIGFLFYHLDDCFTWTIGSIDLTRALTLQDLILIGSNLKNFSPQFSCVVALL